MLFTKKPSVCYPPRSLVCYPLRSPLCYSLSHCFALLLGPYRKRRKKLTKRVKQKLEIDFYDESSKDGDTNAQPPLSILTSPNTEHTPTEPGKFKYSYNVNS